MRRVLLAVLVVSILATGGCHTELGVRDGTAPGGPADGSSPPTDTPVTAGELRVHYLDVGQADATVVEFPGGETMLVDSGDWRQDGEEVLAFLEERGIDRIDHLVATHSHADHIGGHEAVIDHFETEGDGVGAAYDSGVAHTSGTFEEYLDAIGRHDVDLYTVQAGDFLTVGNATVRFLNPPAATESNDLHENSVSLVVDYGENGFAFTGDLERAGERRLVEESASELDADVYQAGHHGSRTSSAAVFLEAVDPRIAVVSSARDSQYGHPHDETLAAFAERGYETYWTGVHGTVTVQTNGTALAVETERDAPTDAAALRNASATATPAGRLHPTPFGGGGQIAG